MNSVGWPICPGFLGGASPILRKLKVSLPHSNKQTRSSSKIKLHRKKSNQTTFAVKSKNFQILAYGPCRTFAWVWQQSMVGSEKYTAWCPSKSERGLGWLPPTQYGTSGRNFSRTKSKDFGDQILQRNGDPLGNISLHRDASGEYLFLWFRRRMWCK